MFTKTDKTDMEDCTYDTIPFPASQLAAILHPKFSEQKPLRFETPVLIILKLDGPGYLDFVDWEVTECYPDNGKLNPDKVPTSVIVKDKDGHTARIEDFYSDDRYHTDEIWLCIGLLDAACGQLGVPVPPRPDWYTD